MVVSDISDKGVHVTMSYSEIQGYYITSYHFNRYENDPIYASHQHIIHALAYAVNDFDDITIYQHIM